MSGYADCRAAEIMSTLEGRDSLPELAPRSAWNPALTVEVYSARPADLFGPLEVQDMEMANCLRSALLLWNDALEESHVISQSIGSQTGSYLHGIMHRREPDYGNSKYWFNRVGEHELFAELGPVAEQVLPGFKSPWDPYVFIDQCEAAARTSAGEDHVEALRRMQLEEMRLLTNWCFARATG